MEIIYAALALIKTIAASIWNFLSAKFGILLIPIIAIAAIMVYISKKLDL